MAKRNSFTVGVLVAAGVVIIAAALWLALGQGRKPPEKLILADATQPVFALVYIAEAKGCLADEGLDVSYEYFTSGRDALGSVIAGQRGRATWGIPVHRN